MANSLQSIQDPLNCHFSLCPWLAEILGKLGKFATFYCSVGVSEKFKWYVLNWQNGSIFYGTFQLQDYNPLIHITFDDFLVHNYVHKTQCCCFTVKIQTIKVFPNFQILTYLDKQPKIAASLIIKFKYNPLQTRQTLSRKCIDIELLLFVCLLEKTMYTSLVWWPGHTAIYRWRRV